MFELFQYKVIKIYVLFLKALSLPFGDVFFIPINHRMKRGVDKTVDSHVRELGAIQQSGKLDSNNLICFLMQHSTIFSHLIPFSLLFYCSEKDSSVAMIGCVESTFILYVSKKNICNLNHNIDCLSYRLYVWYGA